MSTEKEGYGTRSGNVEMITYKRQKALVFLAASAALFATIAVFGGSEEHYLLEETDSSSVTSSDDNSKNDAKKALDLEMSKARYDAAKDRVKKLHEQFIDLETKLGKEVTNLDEARGQLVSQIQGIDGKSAVPAISSEDYAAMPPLQKVVAAVASNLGPSQNAAVYDSSQISKADAQPKVVAAVTANLQPAKGAVIYDPTAATLIKSDAIVHVASAAASAQASHIAAAASQKAQKDADSASQQSQSAASASREAAKAAIVHVVSAAVSAKASSDAAAAAQKALENAADASEHALEAAKDSRNAADASQASLTYTQGVASKVGSLVTEAESEAARIAAAGKVTDEAKSAMQSALEQSSQIVDYNTHAAQAVAQDAGFVSAAAKTVSSFLENIFKDARAVRKAAKKAQKKIKRTVDKFSSAAQASADRAADSARKAEQEESRARTAGTAADEALKTAMTKADDAEQVEKRIKSAELEVAQLASHAGLAARVASDAAAGAAQGEKIAMQASYQARSRLNDINSAPHAVWSARPVPPPAWSAAPARPAWGAAPAQPAWDATPVAPAWGAAPVRSTWVAPPAIVGASVGRLGTGPVYPAAVSPFAERRAAFPYAVNPEANLRSAKELVDTVIVLMQQLTHSLEGALAGGLGRCRRVRELLAWYQAQMSQYHLRGLQIAHTLSEDDMELVEEYAQAQVSTFSAELESVVEDAAEVCEVSTTAFLPDVPAASLPRPVPLGEDFYGEPLGVSISGLAQKHEAQVLRAKERVQKLKSELLAAEGVLHASDKPVAPQEPAVSPQSSNDAKIAEEQAEVAQLKAQVAQLLAKRKSQAKA